MTEFNDRQLARYSRHLLLPEIDFDGQQRICAGHTLIIGAGGLGNPAALYLAGSGVGRITLFDHDHVDPGNLQRQIAFRNSDVDKNKAETLAAALRAINPEIEVCAHPRRAEGAALRAAIEAADVVLDASDNFGTRFALNDLCVETGTPLVSGAAIRFQGQVAVFNPAQTDAPCYRCLYRDEGDVEHTCGDLGVFSPLVGIVGSIQAAEALKILMNSGETLTGRLLRINALTMEIRTSGLKRDPDCPACGN